MKPTDHFDYVDDTALKKRLNNIQVLIVELVILTTDKKYHGNTSLLSSFRKTILIYTAALVEALLLWRLKKAVVGRLVVLTDEWEYKDAHLIYKLQDKEIVWMYRKQVKKRIDKLDFNRVIQKCVQLSLLKDTKLIDDVNQIRQLRNRLHIGNLGDLEENYQPKDIEFGFSVLERVSKQLRIT